MKRYDLDSFDCLVERDDGSLCIYTDVQALQAERDGLREALENIVSETSMMTSTYDASLNVRDIARKALKGGRKG